MRRPFVAGNWKMHNKLAEARALAKAVWNGLRGKNRVDVALCPPFTALAAVAEAIRETPYRRSLRPHACRRRMHPRDYRA